MPRARPRTRPDPEPEPDPENITSSVRSHFGSSKFCHCSPSSGAFALRPREHRHPMPLNAPKLFLSSKAAALRQEGGVTFRVLSGAQIKPKGVLRVSRWMLTSTVRGFEEWEKLEGTEWMPFLKLIVNGCDSSLHRTAFWMRIHTSDVSN